MEIEHDDLAAPYGGEKPTTGELFLRAFPPQGSDLDASLRHVEPVIAQAEAEIAFVFRADGLFLAARSGEVDSVTFADHERRLFPGATLTHNHPAGGWFSVRDVFFAAGNNLAQMRAVVATQVHQLYRPAAGWNHLALEDLFYVRLQRLKKKHAHNQARFASEVQKVLVAVLAEHLAPTITTAL